MQVETGSQGWNSYRLVVKKGSQLMTNSMWHISEYAVTNTFHSIWSSANVALKHYWWNNKQNPIILSTVGEQKCAYHIPSFMNFMQCRLTPSAKKMMSALQTANQGRGESLIKCSLPTWQWGLKINQPMWFHSPIHIQDVFRNIPPTDPVIKSSSASVSSPSVITDVSHWWYCFC